MPPMSANADIRTIDDGFFVTGFPVTGFAANVFFVTRFLPPALR